MENEEIQDKEIFNKIKDFETKSTFTYDRLQFCLNKGLYFTLCNNLKDFACNYYINFKTNNLNNNLMQTPDENSQKESNNAENINLDSSAFLSFVEEYLQPFFKLNFENFKIEDYQEFLSSYKKINKNSNNEKLNIEELSKKEKNKICNQLAEFKKNLKNVNSANADNLLSNYKLEKEFVKNFLEYYYSKNKHETPKFSLIFNLDKNLKVFVLPSPYFYKDKNFFIDGKFYKEFYLDIINELEDEYKEYFEFFNFAKQELSKIDKDFYSNITKAFYKPEQISKKNLLLNFIKLTETIGVFAAENDLETVNNLIEKNSIIFKNFTYTISINNHFSSLNYFNKYYINLLNLKIKTENKNLLIKFLGVLVDLIDVYNKNLEIDKPFAKSLFENDPWGFIENVYYVSSAFLEEEKDFIKTNLFEKAQKTKNEDERKRLFDLINEIDKKRDEYINDFQEERFDKDFKLKSEIYEFFYKNQTSISNKEIKEILNSKTKQNIGIIDLLKLCSLLKAELNKKISEKQSKKDYLSKNFEKLLNKINSLLNEYEEVEKLKSFDNFFKSMLKEKFAKDNISDFIKKTSFDYEKDYSKFLENISNEKYSPKFDEELFNEVCSSSLLNEDIKNSFASGEYYYRIGKNNKNENQTKKVDFTPLGINFLKGGEQFLCACLDYIKQSKKIHLTTKFEMGNKTDFQNIFDESKKTNWVDTSIALKYLKIIFEKTLNDNSVFKNVIENVKLAFKNFTEIRNPLAHKENMYEISNVDDVKNTTYALIVTLLSICKIVKEL